MVVSIFCRPPASRTNPQHLVTEIDYRITCVMACSRAQKTVDWWDDPTISLPGQDGRGFDRLGDLVAAAHPPHRRGGSIVAHPAQHRGLPAGRGETGQHRPARYELHRHPPVRW